MDPLDRMAEARLAEAIAAGEFEGLAGFGQPLELEDLSRVDPELRAGYLLLKGAGFLPEEMELRKEALRLGDLLRACEDEAEARSLEGRRRALLLRLAILRESRHRRGAAGTPNPLPDMPESET